MDRIKELVFMYLGEVALKGVVITHREFYNPYSQGIKTEIEGCIEDYRLFLYVKEQVGGKDYYSFHFDENIFYSIRHLFSLNMNQIDEYLNQYLSSLISLTFNKSDIYYAQLNNV